MHTVALSVVYRDPVGIHFSRTIRAAGPERGFFGLGHFLHFAKHFRTGCLIEAGIDSSFSHCLKDTCGSKRGDIAGVFRNIEAHAHVALGAEVVNLLRFKFIDKLHKVH